MAEEASAAGRPFKMAQCFVADHRLLELKLTRKNSKIESLKEEVTNSRDKIEGQTQQLRQLESEKQKIQEENLILTAKNSAKEDKVSSLIARGKKKGCNAHIGTFSEFDQIVQFSQF